jgi:hypothetical protein
VGARISEWIGGGGWEPLENWSRGFESHEVGVCVNEKKSIIEYVSGGKTGLGHCVFSVETGDNQVIAEVFLPVSVPEGNRHAVQELLERFDEHVPWGKCQVDDANGLVWLRTEDTVDEDWDGEFIEKVLGTAHVWVDMILFPMLAIVFGVASVEEAYQNILERIDAIEDSEPGDSLPWISPN